MNDLEEYIDIYEGMWRGPPNFIDVLNVRTNVINYEYYRLCHSRIMYFGWGIVYPLHQGWQLPTVLFSSMFAALLRLNWEQNKAVNSVFTPRILPTNWMLAYFQCHSQDPRLCKFEGGGVKASRFGYELIEFVLAHQTLYCLVWYCIHFLKHTVAYVNLCITSSTYCSNIWTSLFYSTLLRIK